MNQKNKCWNVEIGKLFSNIQWWFLRAVYLIQQWSLNIIFSLSFFHFAKKNNFTADEHLAELMPIFERLRAQGDLPCTYPLHVGSHGTSSFLSGGYRPHPIPLSPHSPHCHQPTAQWVSRFIARKSNCVSSWISRDWKNCSKNKKYGHEPFN